MSTTTRPAGSTLLFAGLYWGGAARAATPVSVQVGSAPPMPVATDALAAAPLVGIGAVADVTNLRVSTGVDPTTATVGGMVTATVDVSNAGPDDQTGPATLTVSTSDGLAADPVSLTSTTGTCGLIGEFGAEATGPIGATARVLTPTADTDPVPANDTAWNDLESPAP